jgi:hypothetical protein
MELGTIFILLPLIAVVVLFVAYPFSGRPLRHADDDPERISLLMERERILQALQELDFDQSLGKIPAEEYPARRAELLQKGAAILRRLDVLASSPFPGKIVSKRKGKIGGTGAVGRAASRADVNEKHASLSDDDLEDLIAERRAAREDKTAD